MRPLIVGVGNRWRGDDGIGPRVVDAIDRHRQLHLDADLAVLDGEPARLVSAWSGRHHVVVVDAIRTGAAPGTVHRLTGETVPAPVPDSSTHGGGVAAAVALGRALGVLPERLVVVGVEPAVVGHDERLSPAVDGAVDAVVEAIVEEVRQPCA